MKTKPIVLVVDDEPFYRDVLSNLLRDEYDVICVNSGEEALARSVQEPQPDLVLLDVMMPGIDGYEVCHQLKSGAKTEKIPVIFLTVKSDVDDEVRGFNLGGVDYIAKPMSPPIVLARVRTHIKLNQVLISLEKMVMELKG